MNKGGRCLNVNRRQSPLWLCGVPQPYKSSRLAAGDEYQYQCIANKCSYSRSMFLTWQRLEKSALGIKYLEGKKIYIYTHIYEYVCVYLYIHTHTYHYAITGKSLWEQSSAVISSDKPKWDTEQQRESSHFCSGLFVVSWARNQPSTSSQIFIMGCDIRGKKKNTKQIKLVVQQFRKKCQLFLTCEPDFKLGLTFSS